MKNKIANITKHITPKRLAGLAITAMTLIIFYSFCIRVGMFVLGRSLWVDEAALSMSLISRSGFDLIKTPLVGGQTAPILYLFTVKLFGWLFGYTEGPLRMYSFIALILLIPVQILYLLRVLKKPMAFAFVGATITATFSYFMTYSNELKPYMGDGLWCMTALLMAYFYEHKQVNIWIVSAVFSIMLYFSSPVLFFIVAFYIVEFFRLVAEKKPDGKIKSIATFIAGGIIVFIFFVINYLVWLRPVALSDTMVNYWQNNAFKVFTLQPDVMAYNWALFSGLFNKFGNFKYIYIVFSFAGFFISLVKKQKTTLIAGVSLCLFLVASSIEKYPVADRLNMFVYTLVIVYAVSFVADMYEWILTQTAHSRSALALVPITLCVSMIYMNRDFPKQFTEKALYYGGEEANPLIEYVREHIRPGETLYSYYHASSVLQFKNGFENNIIGDVDEPNIIWGQRIWDNNEALIADVLDVIAAGKCYLLFSHAPSSRISTFISVLKYNGRFSLVYEFAGTPLYYFDNTPTDPPVSGGVYALVANNGNIDFAVDIATGTQDDGGNAQLWVWNKDSINQQFRLDRQEDGTYVITAMASDKVLEIEDWSRFNGGNLQQGARHDGANQRWFLVDVGGGYYEIINANSDHSLDIAEANFTNGANIQQNEYFGEISQQFRLEPVD